jgi:hypothetical protein
MGYFKFTQNCQHYKSEWEAVVQQIASRSEYKPHLLGKNPPSHHLEAKALHIFTVARRLILSAWTLYWKNGNNWSQVFVEASTLLFPMLELVGEARKAAGTKPLGVGIRWLQSVNLITNTDPDNDYSPITSLRIYMSKGTPQVRHLYFLRNYYLHGLKKTGTRSITISPREIADMANTELPEAISKRAEVAMREYWDQLKQDDGTDQNNNWIERLAAADIHPFMIEGSGIFEAGLVDPSIVDYLEDPKARIGYTV